jgi:fructose-bisphosphate aldolase/2-amino-3,7-dideoxy-D-threo-hept-6-ulosonate synthase
MDHAAFMGPVPGLIAPAETMRAVERGGADAVMTTFGTCVHHGAVLEKAGLILTLDAETDPEAAVERAICLGAESVKILAFTHTDSLASVHLMRHFGLICDRWGMPLQIEVIPGGFTDKARHTPELIAQAARIAAEAGADYVKTLYTGDPASFRQVVEGCYVPVVILGGDKAESERQLLESLAGALDVGAAGAAMGRNIWSHARPERMTAALAAVIHGERNLDRALAHLSEATVS